MSRALGEAHRRYTKTFRNFLEDCVEKFTLIERGGGHRGPDGNGRLRNRALLSTQTGLGACCGKSGDQLALKIRHDDQTGLLGLLANILSKFTND
jgi:hypothetical protein